jgi:uncharacterized protein (DUF305 family)
VALAAVGLAGCGEGGATAMGEHGAVTSSSTTTASTSASRPTTEPSERTAGPTPSASATAATPTAPTPTAATPAAGQHNQADIDFAAGMVPHHEQAIVMADMALAHGGTDEFVALAKAIKAAQKPEIDQMSGWLVGWGQQVPDATAHRGHSDMGMMSQQDLDDLDAMMGSGFEGMWLTMMVEHHEGAVDMSRTELEKGANPEAKKLAQAIIKTQTAEIAEMKKMANERAN